MKDYRFGEDYWRGFRDGHKDAEVMLARIQRLEGLVAIHEQYLHDTGVVTHDDGAHIWIGKPAQ
jgi:hypothetical protein